MQALLAPLAELADYQDILKDRKKERGFIQISGCVGSQKTHLMYALGDGFEYRVIVFPVRKRQKRHMRNIVFSRMMSSFILQEICFFTMLISKEDSLRISVWVYCAL